MKNCHSMCRGPARERSIQGAVHKPRSDGKVVLVHLGSWAFSRKRFAGICRYGSRHNWEIHLVEHISDAVSYPWLEAVDYWRPDGVIIDGDDVEVPRRLRGVAVHCDADPRKITGRHYGVTYDSTNAADKVIRELMSLDYPHYAYAGYYESIDWSRARLLRFRNALGARFEPGNVLADGDGHVVEYLKRMHDWVKRLPRPCAIFACNDLIARHAAIFCRRLGLAVPDEIAIAGIDNDEALCESTEPELTSATQNFEESGYRAAEMLDRLMRGQNVAPPVQCLSEAILIRRQSTRTAKAGGARYVAALDYIRSKACDGIGVDDVVKFLSMSRRSAERAFRRFVGRTILEEISDVRYQKACCLLKDPTRTLGGLYAECGYRDNISFRRFFRNKAGVSLGEWRKKHS